MDVYCRFLCGDVVVNIKNEAEYKTFIGKCLILKLKPIMWFAKYGFEEQHRNAGVQVIEYGDLCVEFSPAKGFTCGASKGYIDWGSEIVSLDEFMAAVA